MTLRTRHAPLLDVDVTPLAVDELLEELSRAVHERSTRMVLGHNLHSVHMVHTDPDFRDCYEKAEITLVDGMPVLAMLALGEVAAGRRPFGVSRRLGSTDWISECVRLDCMERVAVFGARTESNRAALETLRSRAPHTEFLGIPADPWREEDLPGVVGAIRDFDPQLLLIGMGMPLQERLAGELRRSTEVPVIAAVGGAVDQISGAQSLAPRWLGRMGFEWLWRLASDPRRLTGRYVVEPVRLAGLLLMRRTA